MKADGAISEIVKRDGRLVRYDRSRIRDAIAKALAACGRPDVSLADSTSAQVETALFEAYKDDVLPSVEDIQDVVERVLMGNGLTDIARQYIIYRHDRAMARAARAVNFEVSDNVPYRLIYEVLRWNMEHGCTTVEEINRIIDEGRLTELVRASDLRYQDEVQRAAIPIGERESAVRVVIVAGPSSSGKTTTTIKMSEQLERLGLRFKALNIDNYFFDRELHPIDEFGDYDYETPQALDLELINSHLVDLLASRAVRTPFYDFKAGKRRLDATEFVLEDDEVLLIDSLHGLYDEMTSGIPASTKYRVYVETLGQLRAPDGSFMRWADNRLLRRMLRDMHHRNSGPTETLTHWHYVRRSELQHIIPFISQVDAIVNTALPYELPFLRARLFDVIDEARHQFGADPRRLDAHIRANRVHALLAPLRAVKDDSCIPRDSLLREFIGGSCYRY